MFHFHYRKLFLTTFFPFLFSSRNMICKAFITLTIVISLIINTANCIGEPPMETIKQWTLSNYDFPYNWPVNDKTLYNAEQIVTTGFEIGDNRIFLATPRLFSGVPATISSVSRDAIGDSPVLKVCNQNSFDKSSQYQKFNFRLIQIGLTTLRASNNTIAVISDWYQCTD